MDNRIQQLFNWLDNSTCSFLAVDTIRRELEEKGFLRLRQEESWNLKPGGKYFLIKNESALFAFIAGTSSPGNGFRIIASHSDSPCFKLKPNPEIIGEGGLVSLNVEKYGGEILYTWFDRPLSMSGRVVVESDDILNPEVLVFDLKKPVATIPHLAIHFNREVNEGNRISVQKDMKPVLGYFSKKDIEEASKKGGIVKNMVARRLNISPEKIIDTEIILYPFEKAHIVGCDNEFFQSGRIDDLSMVFGSLRALLDASDIEMAATRIMAVFDNEETGSSSKQGAASPVLRDLLERINRGLGGSHEEFLKSLGNTFMISADNAHAWHPNYSEKYDPTNHPLINFGPVIKINANGKYMTDAVGAAVFQNLCKLVDVPFQYFVNHSDITGGSTLGNIATSQIDIKGVDVGAPVWAMHSAAETAGIADHLDFIKVFNKFYMV